MGRRVGPPLRLPRLRSAGHDERRLRSDPGPARRRDDQGRGAGPRGELAQAVEVPVSADLENCFARRARRCRRNDRRRPRAGWPAGRWRTSRAIPTTRSTSCPRRGNGCRQPPRWPTEVRYEFVLTARAENYLHGRMDLGDTIARLQAYQEAGADVLFAPQGRRPGGAAPGAVCRRPAGQRPGAAGRPVGR